MKKVYFIAFILCITICFYSCNASTKIETNDDDKNIENVIIDNGELQNMDQVINGQLDEVVKLLSDIKPLLSFTVTKSDELLLEKYYGFSKENTLYSIFSDTKSVTSILVGIAIDEGLIDSVDQSIGDYLDLSQYENIKELEKITLKHLLTMSSGLYWDSNNLSKEYMRLKNAREPDNYILSREITFNHGEQFNYSDGSAHLLSIIFTEATGRNLLDFAEEKLFGPLGIEDIMWSDDINDVSYGGCYLYLKSHDMIKIGKLILNKGLYNGNRIVSEEWIEEATTFKIKTGNRSSHSNEYGYYFWLGERHDTRIIGAFGHGGQFIYVIPEKELIVTATCSVSGDDQLSNQTFKQVQDIIVYELFPLFLE